MPKKRTKKIMIELDEKLASEIKEHAKKNHTFLNHLYSILIESGFSAINQKTV